MFPPSTLYQSMYKYEHRRGARDVRPDLFKVLGGLIVVLVLSTIAVIPVESIIASADATNSSLESTSIANTSNVRVIAAEKIINNIKKRIENILSLAERYDIMIPENMTSLVEEAKTLLDNATDLVEENPGEAVKLALKAARVFRPVAVYVLSSLPEDVKEELLKESLEGLVEARVNATESFEEKLAFLEERNVTIPEIVYEKIDQAKELLSQAQAMLENNTHNISDIIGIIRRVDKLLAEATFILYKYFSRIWHVLSLVDAAYHRLIIGTLAIVKAINHTVRLIEENNTSLALNITMRLVQVTDKAIDYLNKTLQLLRQHNASENATRLVETLYNALIEVREYLDKAQSSLEAGDTITALDELNQALNKLVTTLQENEGLIRGLHNNLDKLKRCSKMISEALERTLKKIALRKTAELVIFLGRLKARLYWLEKLYENGNITVEEYANALTHAKTLLENILEHLEKLPRPPEKIVNAIQELLDWINSQLASIQE